MEGIKSTSGMEEEHVDQASYLPSRRAAAGPANMEAGGYPSESIFTRLASPRGREPDAPSEDPPAQAGAPVLVMKFGGSSLATVEHLKRAAEIVKSFLDRRPVLVLSAMGKTTNLLLAAADNALEKGVDAVDISAIRKVTEAVFEALKQPMPADIEALFRELTQILSGVALVKELSGRTRDRLVSFGERLSIRTFAAVYNDMMASEKVQAKPVDSWEAGMLTTSGGGSANSAFSNCEVLPEAYMKLREYFAQFRQNYPFVPVVTGYIAKDPEGFITTLGRDGSDLSATVIGAAVQASEVQIWKDVSGVMTTDPRLVPAAKPVGVLTFEEAAELSTFGAKVVHPAAILPAWIAGVPISVRNSTEPEHPGTHIVADLGKDGELRENGVAAMSSKRDITMIVIRSTRMLGQHGFLAHVFQVFNKYEVSVDVIATSEITVTLTLDRSYKSVDLDALKAELEEVSQVQVSEKMAMITLIAIKSLSTTVLRGAFSALNDNGIDVEMVSHGASNVNVTVVIKDEYFNKATKELHARFFEKEK